MYMKPRWRESLIDETKMPVTKKKKKRTSTDIRQHGKRAMQRNEDIALTQKQTKKS